MMDMSVEMVKRFKDREKHLPKSNLETFYVVGDEEFLPIKEKYACFAISLEHCLSKHTTRFGSGLYPFCVSQSCLEIFVPFFLT